MIRTAANQPPVAGSTAGTQVPAPTSSALEPASPRSAAPTDRFEAGRATPPASPRSQTPAREAVVFGPSPAPTAPAPESLGPARGLNGWSGTLDPVVQWAHEPPAPVRISWWPMINSLGVPLLPSTGAQFYGSLGMPIIGNRMHNHWAAGGCLDKYDRITGASARDYQLKERYRSPVDGAAKIFGIGERWDAFNAGHCNQEAMRASLFRDPERAVTRPTTGAAQSRLAAFRNFPVFGGIASALTPYTSRILPQRSVELSAHDIRGLMVLCMDGLVDPSQGNGGYSYVGWRKEAPGSSLPTSDPRNDLEEPYPHQVIEDVCKAWGERQNRIIVVERHPDETLDNRAYDHGRVQQLTSAPRGFNSAEVPSGGEVKFYAIDFGARAQPADDIHLSAWVHRKQGESSTEVKSGWIHNPTRSDPHGSKHPDFYWIAHVNHEILEGAPWVGMSPTNPEVDMFQVWSMYQDSIGGDWRQLARQYPARVEAHLEALRTKGRTTADVERELGPISTPAS